MIRLEYFFINLIKLILFLRSVGLYRYYLFIKIITHLSILKVIFSKSYI